MARRKAIGAKVVLSFLAAALIVSPALSQRKRPVEVEQGYPVLPPRSIEKQVVAATLDTLYEELKNSETSTQSIEIVRKINKMRFDSGSETARMLSTNIQQLITNSAHPGITNEERIKSLMIARDLCTRIIDMEPKYTEAYNLLGAIAFKNKDYDDALTNLAMTLSLDNRHIDALMGVANVSHALERDDIAMKALNKVLEMWPLSIPVRNMKRMIENSGEPV